MALEYIVVGEKTPWDLRDEVERLAKEGWIPQGGLCIRTYQAIVGATYYQAMIREVMDED